MTTTMLSPYHPHWLLVFRHPVTESEAWIWIYDVQRIHRLLAFLCKLVTYSKIAHWFHLLLTYLLIKISSVALILSINILMNERWALSSKISQMKLKMCLLLENQMPTTKSRYCVWNNGVTISDRSVVTWTLCRRNFQFI